MQGILLLTILSVKSSYIREIEEPTNVPPDVPDTVQWWIAPTTAWRIRTFALDHDLHTYEWSNPPIAVLDLVRKNNKKNFGDVIASEFELHFADCTNKAETDATLTRAGLAPRLELATGRFAFWKPDDARYHTQSTPK